MLTIYCFRFGFGSFQIDLLAAARCNMFSHVLVAYQAALLDFATKTSYTFQAALKILEETPQYSFTILKDLTQVPVVRDNPSEPKEIAPLDFDQMLFFKVRFTHLSGTRNCVCSKCFFRSYIHFDSIWDLP